MVTFNDFRWSSMIFVHLHALAMLHHASSCYIYKRACHLASYSASSPSMNPRPSRIPTTLTRNKASFFTLRLAWRLAKRLAILCLSFSDIFRYSVDRLLHKHCQGKGKKKSLDMKNITFEIWWDGRVLPFYRDKIVRMTPLRTCAL